MVVVIPCILLIYNAVVVNVLLPLRLTVVVQYGGCVLYNVRTQVNAVMKSIIHTFGREDVRMIRLSLM